MFSCKVIIFLLLNFIALLNCHEDFYQTFSYVREGRTECLEDESEFNEFGKLILQFFIYILINVKFI